MTPVRRRACIIALVVGAAGVAHPLAQRRGGAPETRPASDRSFNLGVLRADGTLIPFAQYDNNTWRPIWSATDRDATPAIPLTLSDVRDKWWGKGGPVLDWFLSPAPGAPSQPLRVSSTRPVFVGCAAFPALATDFQPPGTPPPPFQSPYPKAGIATTAPVTLEPIERLREDDVEWRRVARAVDRIFPERERDALVEMEWGHPWPAKERNARPVDVQAIWHARNSRFYWVEAIRRYPEKTPPKGKAPCDLVTYLSGWFWDSPAEEIRAQSVWALISYCHMERATFLWPFGVIREGGRRYWVVQRSGWTSETYAVLEPNPSTGEVRTRAWVAYGACYR